MFKLTLSVALLTLIESAVVFGNDIDVYYSRGDVIVRGDSDGNDLEIRRVHSSVHQFRGLNGTTINGSSEPLFLPIQDDLRMWMLGGNDFVDIRSLYLRSTTHADLIIELGSGDDEILLRTGNVRRDVKISDDFLLRGNDTISVRNCNANSIDVETQGSAHIGVVYNNCSWIAIESGAEGSDFISVVGNEAGLIDINASNENDELILVGNDVAGGFLSVSLNDGNDSAKLSVNVLNRTNTMIDGGDGMDFGSGFDEYQWPWWGNVNIVNFEF